MPLIMMYSNLVDIGFSADSSFVDTDPTGNYSTGLGLSIGNAAANTWRTWMKPDFTTIPSGRTFLQVIINLVPTYNAAATNSRTLLIYRCLRAVSNSLISWNKYSASSWATAGAGNSTTDYDGGVLMGSATIPSTPTLYATIPITCDAAEFQKLYDGTYTNNGLILFVDTETDDFVVYGSRDEPTAAYRASILIEHT